MEWRESYRLFKKYKLIDYEDPHRSLHLYPLPDIFKILNKHDNIDKKA